MKDQIQSLEVSYLVHATEDRPKLDAAVAWLLKTELEPEAEVLEGHFGNEIVLVRYRLTGKDASSAFSSMASKMPPELKGSLREEIEKHVDEHWTLHLRLDKQKLVSGGLEASASDPIKVRVKPRLYALKEPPARFYGRLLG